MYLSKQLAHLLHNALDRIDKGLSSVLNMRTDRSDLGIARERDIDELFYFTKHCYT
jgi:hypothetical protein